MRVVYVLGGMAAAAALLVAGCGGGRAKPDDAVGEPADAAGVRVERAPSIPCPSPSKQVRVTLDGHMGAENVGILMAEKQGYFGDRGLHVWVGAPANPAYPVSYVATGSDDIGLAQLPQVVLAEELGESVVGFGSVISEPTEALIWLRNSGIDDVADLEGKTITTPGVPFQEILLERVLANAGLTREDVQVLPGGYELAPTLLRGQVDAIFGGSANLEGAALEARGAESVITPVKELGVPAYDELVVIAREKCLAKYPAMYRRFMAAVKRGTNAAMADPRGAARLIAESLEAEPGVNYQETAAEVKATLPLLAGNGQIDLDRAADFGDWMREKGMVEAEPPIAKLFTNDYLVR